MIVDSEPFVERRHILRRQKKVRADQKRPSVVPSNPPIGAACLQFDNRSILRIYRGAVSPAKSENINKFRRAHRFKIGGECARLRRNLCRRFFTRPQYTLIAATGETQHCQR